MADGLKTCLGKHTFPIVASGYVDGIIRVTEDDIIGGQRLIWERMKLVCDCHCLPSHVMLHVS